MKESGPPPAGVGAEENILPEGGVFGGPTGGGDGELEAENSEVTGSSAGMMGVVVGQGDQATLLLPEVALLVRPEVRVRSMRKSPSGAGSEAQRLAARPMRVTWLPRTRRPPHPRRESSRRPLLRRPHQAHHLCQPQPAILLPGAGGSLLQEGCHLAGGGAEGGPLLLSAQAGVLRASLWFQRSLQWALYRQVGSL